ncbi:MAG: ATP-binding cassette domain-containing protein, partial [Anaerolineaceae bacterium]
MIETEHLSKQFHLDKKHPPITAVSDLTLNVNEGEVFGFLGPNGAGKTTTVRMLTSLIAPTQGRARINGFEVGRDDQGIRRSVGILTETPGRNDRLSAEKNLTIFANQYGGKDVP